MDAPIFPVIFAFIEVVCKHPENKSSRTDEHSRNKYNHDCYHEPATQVGTEGAIVEPVHKARVNRMTMRTAETEESNVFAEHSSMNSVKY